METNAERVRSFERSLGEKNARGGSQDPTVVDKLGYGCSARHVSGSAGKLVSFYLRSLNLILVHSY